MIGNLLERAAKLNSRFSLSGRGQKALASAVGFAGAHPTIMGMGAGGAGGFIASGGSLGGLAVGAAAGGILGGRGKWTSYQQKVKGTGTGLAGFRSRLASNIGKQVSRRAPGLAESLGPLKKRRAFKPLGNGSNAGIYYPNAGMKYGHARNLGGKRLGAAMVGIGMAGGVGAMGGAGLNMTGAVIGGLGNTFSQQSRALYGNAFSGMGNGTVTGY